MKDFIVADYAKYYKLLEVLTLHDDTTCAFIMVTGERFHDSGFSNLTVEAKVL